MLATVGVSTLGLTAGNGAASEHEADDEDGDGADDEANGEAEAMVRVAHLSPDAPAVNVYVDAQPDGNEPAVAGLEFTDVTGYLPLPVGEREVIVTAAGDDEPISPTPLTLELGEAAYTVAAIGKLEPDCGVPAFTIDVLVDDLSPLEDGTGRVRVYHAVPDAPAVDVGVGPVDDPELFLAKSLVFSNSGPDASVDAGTYPVTVYPANCLDPVAGPLDVEVRDGQVLTVFATGTFQTESGDPSIEPVLAYEEAMAENGDDSDDSGDGSDEDSGDH
ncbi:DUF4397 domain-containing protein [Halomicrobium urmianum]|uniref:DUF4397 domain-containing protein n=1 Tax=Halomicrobium urmianum TaxID=1586233 RepID=UPI001CD91F43|nr:DUF4397 domain-containing protein [Halomicrobium urmianum]